MPRPHSPKTLACAAARAVALLWALCLAFSLASAQPADPVDARLDTIRQTVDGIQKRLQADATDEELNDLRAEVLAAQVEADKIAGELAPTLKNVEARLTELGPSPAGRGTTEAPDIAEQRANLEKGRKSLDAQVKLARLLAVEGGQAAEEMTKRRRAQFNARLGERTASILSGRFWQELRESWPRDLARLRNVGAELSRSAAATPPGIWLMLAVLAAGAIAARIWAGRWLLKFTKTRVPPGRLRRSLLALAMTLLSVAAPGMAAHLLRLGFTWTAPPSDAVQAMLGSMVGMVFFCAYIEGIGRALLSARRPSWRLPLLYDPVAHGMRHAPLVLTIVIGIGWLCERLATTINASLATVVAINCIFALTLGMLMAQALRHAEMLRRAARAAQPESAAAPSNAAWIGAVATWLVLVASLVCLVLGYVALGAFAVKQVAWVMTVLVTTYLVNAVIDDALMAWVEPPKDERAAHVPLLREQVAVLISALLRLTVLLFGLISIVAPFGQGPEELFQRAGRLQEGLTVGEISLRPGTLLQAFLVLVLGIVCVRLMQRWLSNRYLPTTSLDAGMRESATTLLGYFGTVVAVALALSAIGLGLERIAWVASALSVGIGFGLQAVVQNFVSGLILLAERPVKVGDWVTLPGVDGDIRRINVRATEIQMSDRSTVIVPNSEFITKIVRNVTHASPLGLVQIKLPMPLETDAQRVRELMLAAFCEHESVLEAPAPNVFLDGIENGQLVFNATGYVNSPRQAYAARSALLFVILQRLRDEDIAVGKPPTMVLREGGVGTEPSA